MKEQDYADMVTKLASQVDISKVEEVNPRILSRLIFVLEEMERVGNTVSSLKAGIFYRRPVEQEGVLAYVWRKLFPWFRRNSEKLPYSTGASSEAVQKKLSDPKDLDFLHSVLGIFSESAELASALLAYLKDKKGGAYAMDRPNIMEELGDLDFYARLAKNSRGFSDCQIRVANRNKLQKRYGSKLLFIEERANNRDLSAERRVIEADAKSAEME